MKIGLDSFSLHPLELDTFAQLDFAARHGFEGLHGGFSLDADPGRLTDVRAYADSLNLYTEADVGNINPCLAACSAEELMASSARRVEKAAACGWHEIHCLLGNGEERYTMSIPWTRQLTLAAELIQSLRPVLRDCGSRLNLETHGDTTTFELIRLIEAVGEDVVGICLDTANVFCHAEDPLLAARRAAPYTHMTHVKDAIIFFIDTGVRRQTLPVGRGAIPWPDLLSALATYAPDLHLSIEDHKWFFEAHIFDQDWLALHPDLTRDELARVARIAWQCQQRIASGELLDPYVYEGIPYKDEVEQRLTSGLASLQKFYRDLNV
jgi:sugar phosphate isomerase/epimerase